MSTDHPLPPKPPSTPPSFRRPSSIHSNSSNTSNRNSLNLNPQQHYNEHNLQSLSELIRLQQSQINLLRQQEATILQEKIRRRESGGSFKSEPISPSDEEAIARQNPLVASALARRKKRESLTLESIKSGAFSNNGPGSRSPRSSEDSLSLRTPSPTGSTTSPAVFVFKPGDTYPFRSGDNVPTKFNHALPPLPVRSSSMSSSSSASSPPAPTSASASTLNRKSALFSVLQQRPSSSSFDLNSLSLYGHGNGTHRSVSDPSILSPFAPTFQPPTPSPPITSSLRYESEFHPPTTTSQRNSMIFAAGGGSTMASAMRQPMGPASEDDLVKLNFSSRIRRKALFVGRLRPESGILG
jgi:hypothetical protein